LWSPYRCLPRCLAALIRTEGGLYRLDNPDEFRRCRRTDIHRRHLLGHRQSWSQPYSAGVSDVPRQRTVSEVPEQEALPAVSP